ncbi:hypothetical protein LCGC14_1035960 [marine sediment metagenome]|uniref:Uncharacterized protein n=1 Tax=marine sediment metagenome TaxID=412755 RepID=A0A0F9QBG2_9ZZZZ
MNDLELLLTPQEEIDIEAALKNAFTLQDKPIKKDQFEILLNEVLKSKKPFRAIIAGLDSLKSESLRRLTFYEIMTGIDKFIENPTGGAVSCDHCSKSGFFVMRDDEGRNFSLACTCQNGDRVANQGNTRWNGQNMQSCRGRMLTALM